MRIGVQAGRTAWVLAVALATLALAAIVLLPGLRPRERAEVVTRLALEDALGSGDTAGYARALEPRPFVFPGDHGPHPRFRIEWWYLTGNLDTGQGRRFGYQLTIFRSALSSDEHARASAWATTQAYMAHFAVTDVEGRAFHAFDRFARGAAGLAGATAEPFRVWLDDWEIAGTASNNAARSAAAGPSPGGDENSPAILPLRVRARSGDIAIDLRIDSGKPIVLHGENGLSRKGAEPGNASYYYSFTRLPTTGRVHTREAAFLVEGTSWFDREWSTSQLGADIAGWDWFAIQLDDGTDIMVFRLRRKDGTDALRGGTLVNPDGESRTIEPADIDARVTGAWNSPIDGARYPARWALRLAPDPVELDIIPVLPDQELNLAVRYWEGAVDVTGSRAGAPVRGRGYVELTGYAGEVTGSAR